MDDPAGGDSDGSGGHDRRNGCGNRIALGHFVRL